MNHDNSYRPIEFGHFPLISWFTVKRMERGELEREIDARGAKNRGRRGERAIVGENPAGPFVYEHCLAYSTPHHGLRLYIRAVTT